MRILLLSPPLNSLTHPYSSLPTLTGFLRERGHEVAQCDMGIEAMDALLSREGVKRMRERLESWKGKGSKRIQEALLFASTLEEKIDEAKEVFRSKERFYLPDDYTWASQMITRAQEMIAAIHPPFRFQSETIRTGVPTSFVEIESFVMDSSRNPFRDEMRRTLTRLLADENPELVGISITYPWQIFFGFALAQMVREMAPEAAILFGGASVSLAEDSLRANPDEAFRWSDGYVFGEGEGPLENLLNILEHPDEAEGIHENLFLAPEGMLAAHIPAGLPRISPRPKLDEYATPDYFGLDLKAYLSPDTLFILTNTKGCYYGKCAFCSYGYGNLGRYAIRSRKKVENDLHLLHERHQANYVFFADDCVPPKRCREIADFLLDSGMKMHWSSVIRYEQAFSEELVEKMSKSGCRYATIGNESGNAEVLKMMRKGVKPEVRDELLNRLSTAGIGVNLQNFIGFPGESKEQALETVQFLLAQRGRIMSMVLGGFVITHGSAVAREPEKFGINKMKNIKPENLFPDYGYSVEFGPDPEAISSLADQLYSFLGLSYPANSFFIDTPSGAHAMFYLGHYGWEWVKSNICLVESSPLRVFQQGTQIRWAEGVCRCIHQDGVVSLFNRETGARIRLANAEALCTIIDRGEDPRCKEEGEEKKCREKHLARLERAGFFII